MDIAYLHLYVKSARVWQDWFVEKLNFQPVPVESIGDLGELAVHSGQILILLSSEQSKNPEVSEFLHHHSEGVADVAFMVKNLDAIATQIKELGEKLTHPIQTCENPTGTFRWCRIQGWSSVRHTLIEPQKHPDRPFLAGIAFQDKMAPIKNAGHDSAELPWLSVDHAVLNVPSGTLKQAATWYERHLGFVQQQQFAIATAQSGLRSLVLKHPEGNATLPINEPTSQNSQIQEFLDLHQGAGIQHVALHTRNLVKTVAVLRQRKVSFLPVPRTYYQQLRERPGFWREAGDWEAIAQQQLLVDWPREEARTRLLQTFTQPLFEQPTFFLELIERQTRATVTGIKRAEGFGEGNFQALFEAIEREQEQRGTL